MIAALATSAFLIAGWAALYCLLVSADDGGSKILAALKGQSLLAFAPIMVRPVTVRFAARAAAPRARSVRSEAEWRAAA